MIRLLVLVIVLGLVAWLIMAFLPLPYPFPQIIWVIMGVCIIWEVLALAGYVQSPFDRLNRRP